MEKYLFFCILFGEGAPVSRRAAEKVAGARYFYLRFAGKCAKIVKTMASWA